jgi:branched-chain amino acid transport system substrate-binding protein
MRRLIWAFATVLMFFACGGYSFAKEAVRIGLITPLTGDVKTFGESTRNAFTIALEEYAIQGKYKIVPIIVDDRNDPTEGANGALKLITQDRVVALIGPLTSKVAIPVSEIADRNRIPMITGSATNPKVTLFEGKRKTFVFRACYTDPFQGTVGARFALNDLKARTAAVLYDVGNDYSKGLAEYFKSTFANGGGRIVGFESYQKDDVDFSAIITKVRMKMPDVIYIPDYYNKVALIARQVREKGLKSIMLGGDGWDSPDLLKNGGNAVVGGYFTNHYSPDRKDPVAESFIKTYRQKHGVVPDALGALAYDSTAILLKALDGADKPTGTGILKALTGLKGYKGVTGNIGFDKNGDAVKSVVLLKVEQSGARYVTTINP